MHNRFNRTAKQKFGYDCRCVPVSYFVLTHDVKSTKLPATVLVWGLSLIHI